MSSGLETEFTANGSFQDDEHTLSQSQMDSNSGSVNGLVDSGGPQGPSSPLRCPANPATAEVEVLASLNSEQANGTTGPGKACTFSCLRRGLISLKV